MSTINFHNKYSMPFIINSFICISSHELCEMSNAKSNALLVSEEPQSSCTMLCDACAER